MDKDKIKKAVSLFLEGIGEDPEREGLLETPERIAKMCEELFGGYEADAAEHLEKTFSSTQKGLVLEKDITFYSVCEHHLLPFFQYLISFLAFPAESKNNSSDYNENS